MQEQPDCLKLNTQLKGLKGLSTLKLDLLINI